MCNSNIRYCVCSNHNPPPPQFGGKLVTFDDTRGADVPKHVRVSQVITEGDLLNRSNQLEESLSRQQFSEFCEAKIGQSSDTQQKNIWNFLKV